MEIRSRAELRRWLTENHAVSGTIWLVTYKKAQADMHVPYDDIVEEALCFGWVDSLPRALDAERTMLRLSPRKPGSAWSGLNKARIEKLAAAGHFITFNGNVCERLHGHNWRVDVVVNGYLG